MNNLKLISLNIWGGRLKDQLLDFISRNKDVDVFCLQEVFNTDKKLIRPAVSLSTNNIFEIMSDLLSDHKALYCPMQDDEEGMSMLVRKSIPITKTGHIFIFRWKNAMNMSKGEDGRMLGRTMQYSKIIWKDKVLIIAHLHGLWNGQGKTDSPDRLKQSKKAKDFLKNIPGPKILMGDFNLLPDTTSIKILEKNMRNLIKEYNITSTRSSLYDKADKYADYALVTSDIKVVDFKVLPDTVSDHAPLYLEIE